MGGRGPSSPNGPNSPLHGSESAKFRAPRIADPSAEGAARSAAPQAPASEKRGSEFQQIPSRGEGRLDRWASWDKGFPWRAGGAKCLTLTRGFADPA
eukprot:7400921-Alexandrium_andersonii.AAC.1